MKLKVLLFAFIIALSYSSSLISTLLDISRRLDYETLLVDLIFLSLATIVEIITSILEKSTILAE